ncbi:MAG: amino acid racemase [Pseudomonadota bacterium]
MKTLGIIGGVSPASTAIYYRAINDAVNARVGGHNSARIILNSLNFADVQALQAAEDWDAADAFMADAATVLNRAGVDVALLACNTMHRCADAIESALNAPFLHISDATRAALDSDQRARPALLGTMTTMTERFIADRLGDGVVFPDAEQRDIVDRIIFEELCSNVVRDDSRFAYLGVIEEMKARGADSVIFGCTEIGMLVPVEQSPLPVYDTAHLHVAAAVDAVLAD